MPAELKILALAALLAAPASADPLKAIVLRTRAQKPVPDDTANVVNVLLVGALAKVSNLEIIEETAAIEQLGPGGKKQLDACEDDSSCASEIGGALGVDYLLSSSLGAIGTKFVLALRIVETRTGNIAARVNEPVPRDEDVLADALCPRTLLLMEAAAKKDPRIHPAAGACGAGPIAAPVAEVKPVEVKPAPVAASEGLPKVAEMKADPVPEVPPGTAPVLSLGFDLAMLVDLGRGYGGELGVVVQRGAITGAARYVLGSLPGGVLRIGTGSDLSGLPLEWWAVAEVPLFLASDGLAVGAGLAAGLGWKLGMLVPFVEVAARSLLVVPPALERAPGSSVLVMAGVRVRP